MPDISKIRLEDNIYNIKDQTARNNLQNINEHIDIEESNKTIFLGDSYIEGYSPDGNIAENERFAQVFCKLMGITDYQIFYRGGIGFYQEVANINILRLLQNNIDNITNKDLVKNIIVPIGWNDCYSANSTKQNISNAIRDFVEYCKIQFPNATVYIAQVGYCTSFTENNREARLYRLQEQVTPAYANTSVVNGKTYVFLNGLQYTLHNSDLMSSDGVHPNVNGHLELAKQLYNAFKSQAFVHYTEYFQPTLLNPSGASLANIEFVVNSNNNIKQIGLNDFSIAYNADNRQNFIVSRFTQICNNTSKTVRPVYKISFPCSFLMIDSDDNTHLVNGMLEFENGTIGIQLTLRENLTNIGYIRAFPSYQWIASNDLI